MRLIDADALWMEVIHTLDYCDDILEIIEHQKNIWSTHPNDFNTLETLDCIGRQEAIDALAKVAREHFNLSDEFNQYLAGLQDGERAIRDLPSAQLERDVPVKPIETNDRAWGIPDKQAVCPKCGCYLGHVAFLGDYKGKRVTYCETCGQAIYWEGWDFDE